MSLWLLPAELVAWVVPLTLALDARQHPRFAALLAGLPGGPSLLAPGYSRARRNRNEFPTTERELSVMAALAQMGLIRSPKKGYSPPPAATGTLKALYMNARNRFLAILALGFGLLLVGTIQLRGS
jgi:hypothetical protein